MNIAKAAMVWVLEDDVLGRETVCTVHVRADDERDPFDETDLLAITVALNDFWNTAGPYGTEVFPGGMKDFYPPTCRLNRLEAERVLPTPSDKYVLDGENSAGTALSFSGPLGGQRALMHPPQVAWLISTKTTGTQRFESGRLYLPAADKTLVGIGSEVPTEVERAHGRIGDPLINDLGYLAANLRYYLRWASGTEFEFNWVVYSRTYMSALAVTHYEVHEYLRTQRRRQVEYSPTVLVGGDGDPL